MLIAFYTAKNDPAHISFVNEANHWLAGQAVKHLFLTFDNPVQNKLILDALFWLGNGKSKSKK